MMRSPPEHFEEPASKDTPVTRHRPNLLEPLGARISPPDDITSHGSAPQGNSYDRSRAYGHGSQVAESIIDREAWDVGNDPDDVFVGQRSAAARASSPARAVDSHVKLSSVRPKWP